MIKSITDINNCNLALCPVPTVINGQLQYTSLSINSTATLLCDIGYESVINSDEIITCTSIDENTAVFLPVAMCDRK